jgi:hypothetical protein
MPSQRIDQPGLKLRVSAEGRRISSQHRQLDAIYARVVAALERGAEQDARDALQRFRDAWDAHTSLEDGFYFPALRGLRPELGSRLDALSADHVDFREAIERIEAGFGDAAARGDALDRFVTGLAEHERREEALLAEITEAGGKLPAP